MIFLENYTEPSKKKNPEVSEPAGFTLIELLVVISIIALLASVVLAVTNSARAKARDARRVADLRQIALAMELYYDTNGGYPPDAGWCDSSKGVTAVSCDGFGGNAWPAGGLTTLESQGYIPKVPLDPLNNASYYYYYEPVGAQTQFGTTCPGPQPCAYIIGALLENSSNPYVFPACNACVPSRNYCISGGDAHLGASC